MYIIYSFICFTVTSTEGVLVGACAAVIVSMMVLISSYAKNGLTQAESYYLKQTVT